SCSAPATTRNWSRLVSIGSLTTELLPLDRLRDLRGPYDLLVTARTTNPSATVVTNTPSCQRRISPYDDDSHGGQRSTAQLRRGPATATPRSRPLASRTRGRRRHPPPPDPPLRERRTTARPRRRPPPRGRARRHP